MENQHNNNINNNNRNNQLILYPSNWIYNASIIGLLKVLELCKISFNINKTVSINPSSIKSAYKGIFNYHQQKLKENFYIWGKNNRYPNYIQDPQKDFFEKYYIPSLEKISKSNTKKCSWCSGYFIPQNILDNLKDKFRGHFDFIPKNILKNLEKKFSKDFNNFINELVARALLASVNICGCFIHQNILDDLKDKFQGDFDKFIDQREKFQAIHFSALGAPITKTPNFFWNSNYSIPICHLCSFLIIFNHLAFIKTEEGEIFKMPLILN